MEKTTEVRTLFARFAALHADPVGVLATGGSSSCKDSNPPTPTTPCSAVPILGEGPPWERGRFAAAARAALRRGIGSCAGAALQELHANLWPEAEGGGNVDGAALLEIVAGVVRSAGAGADTDADCLTARQLLHYEQLSGGADVSASAADEDIVGDPLRAEVRMAGVAMSVAMKAYAQAEHRERREHERRRLRPPAAVGTASPGPPPDGEADVAMGSAAQAPGDTTRDQLLESPQQPSVVAAAAAATEPQGVPARTPAE